MKLVLRLATLFLVALLLIVGPGFFPLFGWPRAAVADERLIQQATALFEAGQYQQAKDLWQQATTRGDALPRAVAWGNLALTLQQLGQWDAADQAIAQALNLLKPNPPSIPYAQILDIQGHLAFGRGRFQAALELWQQSESFYTSLKAQSPTSQPIGEGLRLNQLNQAQAMQMLGLFNQAQDLLRRIEASAQQQSDPRLKVHELRALLEVSAKLGQFATLGEAQTLANRAEATIAQLPAAQQAQERAALLLSLGHISRTFAERERELTGREISPQGQRFTQGAASGCKTYLQLDEDGAPINLAQAQQALQLYQQAGQLANPSAESSAVALQSQLHQLTLAQELGQSPAAASTEALKRQIQQLPPSRTGIFAQIHLAQALLCNPERSEGAIAQQLSTAATQAHQIQDKRAESYALGTLAKLYEQQGATLPQQLAYAQQLSEKALLLSDSIDAFDISYQWQWQLGHILRQRGGEANRRLALERYYPQAIQSLEAVRGELVGTNPDVQFSFRDNAEPLYREYVDLLLSEPNPSPERLKQAIELIDSLQVAELENFFRCVLSQLVQITQVTQTTDPESATLYPIILPDRVEVILQLPDQPNPVRYSQAIPNAPATIDKTTRLLKNALIDRASDASNYQQPGEQLYRWLLQGAEPYLQQSKVKTLVFVLDGGLRDIPIAALWDGQAFVVQKYAVAITPGLKLLGPQRFEQKPFKALIGGLTSDQPTRLANSRQELGALPFVKQEIRRLKEVIPESTILEDQQFVPSQIAQALKQTPYPIVHLATHGIFSDNPKETYLVTAKNELIDIDRLQELLRTGKGNRRDALELLMLSACQTAKGNRRATLGMAGVAIRAGASSTVATLWSVDDQSTSQIVEQFYRKLRGAIERRDGTTKAQALRQAQLTMLENDLPKAPASSASAEEESTDFSHPYYWAPFILLGNWL
jgi:CHAT domain-containing protein